MTSAGVATPISAAVELFLVAKQAQRCSPATVKHYAWVMRKFCAWLDEHHITTLDELTPYVIRAYLTDLHAHYSAGSVHDLARVVKTFCRFLDVEELSANPFARVAMPKLDAPILPAFTLDDITRLLSRATGHRDKAIIYTLLDTGLRASELCALQVGDVTLSTGAIHVRSGKGGKGRIVYLGAKSLKALRRYRIAMPSPSPTDPLFVKLGGGHLVVSGLQTMLVRLGQQAGVAHCHPHTFRRTFALWSLRAGMNIYALQQIMGHSDLAVLRRYLALVEEDLHEAHREHGAVDRMLA